MPSLSSENIELVHDCLVQLRDAIIQLREWNKDVPSMEVLVRSELGMQRLAGNCMLIEAIGEGFKKLHKMVGDELFNIRPEIPWAAIMGMRNRIAHGYFEIDIEHIDSIVQNDLLPLLDATNALIEYTNSLASDYNGGHRLPM